MNVKTKLIDCLRPLLLSAVLLGSGAASAAEQPLDRIVATVNNDVITQNQLNQRVAVVKRTILQRGAALPDNEDELRKQVLERLIVENLQLQIGDRAGIRITDEELNQAIGTIAQRNGMGIDQFKAALMRDGTSYDDAREQVRSDMIINKVRQNRVAARIQVSDQEVKNFLASDLGKMQLSEEFHLANIMVPTPEGAPAPVIQAAAKRAEELYTKLKQGADFGKLAIANSAGETALEGGDMGWRKAAQLPPPFDHMISASPVGDILQPIRTPSGFIILKVLEKRGGETQLRDEIHVRHILLKPSEIRSDAETKRLIDKLYERIQSGESFADLAKTYSEDPGSALNGGDLNWIAPEALVPEFRKVMADSATGVVSKPFRTQFGWHILEVLGRRATDSTEQVRQQQAMNVLRNRKYDEELQNWLRQIRDEAYVDIKL